MLAMKSSNNIFRISALSMAFAVTGFHQQALAGATAEASAFNFRHIVSDLNPADGIAPVFAWTPPPDYGSPYLEGFYGSDFVLYATPQDNALLKEEWSDGGNAISAGIEGALALDTTALTSTATSAGNPYFGFETTSRTKSMLATFVLSPGAEVSFLVDYALSGSVTDSVLEDSRALAEVWAYGVIYDANGDAIKYDFTNAYNLDTDGNIRTGTLTVTLSNTTGDYANGTMNFATSNYARSIIPTVPEPGTYAMLLGGLVLLSCLRKRASR